MEGARTAMAYAMGPPRFLLRKERAPGMELKVGHRIYAEDDVRLGREYRKRVTISRPRIFPPKKIQRLYPCVKILLF